ncbi:TPA: hypothetical protein DDZ86_02535 [Candidatus Dependentiae bacterium]|nr:MAG: Amino acid transporter [candidate division TM6 bacterium GW2011_GWF2_43_87]HBL98496.1 hypothetical protein [Candidatus Dependentiae bacterium]
MRSSSGTLGFPMAVILGLNAVIGAGIFGVPAVLQTQAGSIGLISYLFVIGAVLCMALALARMAALYPSDSVFYNYPKLWAGNAGGIAATVAYVLGLVIALGLMAQIAGSYVALYSPFLSTHLWAGILVSGVTLLCLMGGKASTVTQIVLIILTILPLVFITTLCFSKASISNLTPLAPYGIMGAFVAIKVVVFGFFGFEAIPSLFSSIKEPQKNVPRAIIATIVIAGAVYFVFTAAIMMALPRALFTSSATPLSSALLVQFSNYKWLVAFINWSIIITIAGTLHSMLLSVSALVVDTGSRIGVRSERFNRPMVLIGMGCLALVSASVFSSLDLMFSLTSLGIVSAYAAAIVPLLTYERGGVRKERKVAIAGLLGAALIFLCGLFGVFGV